MKKIIILAILFITVFPARAASSDKKTGSPQKQKSPNIILPVNQVLTPAGVQIYLPGIRPNVMAISPDNQFIVVSGITSELIALNHIKGEIIKRVPMPLGTENTTTPSPSSSNILQYDRRSKASYSGLIFSRDGRKIFLSNVNGDIKVFVVDKNDLIRPSHTIKLPPANAPMRKEEIPTGLAVSEDGQRLYVCGNLSNRLLEIDIQTGKVTRTFKTGVAPFDVIIHANKAYVSNWGGRQPGSSDLTGPAGNGTVVRVDPVRYIASEGSVSVISLDSNSQSKELLTGLHASALAIDPTGKYIVCANAGSDTISVIDTTKDIVIETIWTKLSPAELFGASPNGVCFSPDGKYLYVANGTQNAIAVIEFKPSRGSKLLGLIPVGWYPATVVFDKVHNKICVANIKALPENPTRIGSEDAPKANPNAAGFNSRQYCGSVSVLSMPGRKELSSMSTAVYRNYFANRIQESSLPPRTNISAKPVPERIGEPSLIKHVVYIIKENRTYDQIMGDMPEGNGAPELCVFGENVTPNHHKLAREFVLLDNTYCCGILSADGHQWSTTAFSTDYVEKSFGSWPRSYPDGMGENEVDALAYAPSGFIWDNAIRHGVSIYNFGEFAIPDCRWNIPNQKRPPTWKDFWEEFLYQHGKVIIGSKPGIKSIEPFTPTNYVGWSMDVPDVWRARFITNQINKWDSNGSMPQFVIICLPNDHTSGTSPGLPTPAAYVADNDLALGQIVEAFSHSKFWKEMAIFVIEDDPQNGFDHVSGYRTVAFVISPWAKRKTVVSTRYNTTSILRTIEQILGLPPMNQFDAAAIPMSDCFSDTLDFSPYTHLPNKVPLDQLNPEPKQISNPILRKDAIISSRLNFKQVDACPETTLNKIIWNATKGPDKPFPIWAVSMQTLKDND